MSLFGWKIEKPRRDTDATIHYYPADVVTAICPGKALTLDEAISAALRNHQRIEQFRARTDQATAAVGKARSSFLPGLSLNYDYLDRDKDPHNQGLKTSTLAIAATINLFNGMSDYHRYNAARQRAEGADYQLKGTRADVILEAQQAFIEVLRAARSVDTADEGVELLEQQRRDAQLQFDYGLIARNDLLRVEVELSNARQTLLQASGQQQIARRQLERTIGISLPTEETLTELSPESLKQFEPLQRAEYQRQMLKNRSEINYLRRELSAAKGERSASKGKYLPTVDLSASHEEYGDTLSPLESDESDNLLTVKASWTLFDGFSREEDIAAADAGVRAISAELRDTEAALTLQLESALQNNLISLGRQQEARSGVISAEENYRVTKNRFNNNRQPLLIYWMPSFCSPGHATWKLKRVMICS